MAKELPYFRFTVAEWMNGDIQMVSKDVKGDFADICAFYWFKDCSITLAKLKQKYINAIASIDILIDNGIIKHNTKTDFIEIDFLDEQYGKLSNLHEIRALAGRKGGLSKTKAKLKQKTSYKDKDNDKKKKKIDKDITPLSLAIYNFMLMRKNIKKPLSEKGKELLLIKLDKLAPGNDEKKIEILEKSIFHSWQGVFPLDGDKKTNAAIEMEKFING